MAWEDMADGGETDRLGADHGFYIDSASSDNQLDKAVVLIIITALLNIGIDTTSQFVRRRLKISAKLVTST